MSGLDQDPTPDSAVSPTAIDAAGPRARARPWTGLAGEWSPTLRLAGPVVLAELGWMVMGLVDTLMVAPLGPAAIGAAGLGSSLHVAVSVLGMGLLLGLDAVVSRSYGEGKVDDCHRWLVQGVILALAMTLPLMAGVALIVRLLPGWGLSPEVLELVVPFLRAENWSTLPLLIYAAFRRHAQGMGQVKPLIVALLAANLMNVCGNALLIHGRLGFPALGVVGSAWATCLARLAMAAVLVVHTFRHDARFQTGLRRVSLRPDPARLRHLVVLGAPAAAQVGLEVGVFATATAMAGRFAPEALAAHQIVLNVSSLTFMVPLGVSSAGAVRVGQALGRRDPAGAARAGWASLALGFAFMVGSSLVMVLLPRTIVGAYSTAPAVLSAGVALMAVAAAFQPFDGLQVIATGVLRGAGDTRTPMLCNVAAHWLIGLPVGWAVGIAAGRGVVGLWVGLSTGLILAGVVLLYAWSVRAARLAAPAAPRR